MRDLTCAQAFEIIDGSTGSAEKRKPLQDSRRNDDRQHE
jgi:hypothetical protein